MEPIPFADGPGRWAMHQMFGRVPVLGDDVEPWLYAGWMRYYVLEFEFESQLLGKHLRAGGAAHELVAEDRREILKRPWMQEVFRRPSVLPPARYSYLQACREAGKLIDAPLPPVLNADGVGNMHQRQEDVAKILWRWMDLLDGRYDPWQRLRLILQWFAWGLGVEDCYPVELDADSCVRLYKGVDLRELLIRPCDVWGSLLSQKHAAGWNPNAFFPTPWSVTELMAEMTFADYDREGRDMRPLTACDPCIGTGRMMLAAGARVMRVAGQDIDWLMVLSTKVNMALFMPWGAFPLGAEFWKQYDERPAAPAGVARWSEDDAMEAFEAGQIPYNPVEVAKARTANICGEMVQCYLPGFEPPKGTT